MTQKSPTVAKQSQPAVPKANVISRSLKSYQRIVMPLLPLSALSALLISLPTLISHYYITPLKMVKNQPIDWHQALPHWILALATIIISSATLSLMFLCTDKLMKKPAKLSLAMINQQFQIVLKKLPSLLFAMIIYSFTIMAGFLLLIIPGIFVAVMLILHSPAILFDHYKALASLKYSWRLVWGNWWYVFSFLLLFVLVNLFINLAASMLLNGITIRLYGSSSGFLQQWLTRAMVNSVITPWAYAGILLLYQYSKRKLAYKQKILAASTTQN